MASTSLSVHQKAIRSNVAKKALMAVTGLVLICFLLMHMFGNLKIFVSPEAYNYYADWLKHDLLYPILPHGWFIWLFRIFLVVCLVLHIYLMAILWNASLHGRGAKYVRKNRKEQTLSAKLMRWGGITLGLLLVFHLLMFTTGTITPGFAYAVHDPYHMFLGAFSQWWVVLIYAIFVAVVCMHVRHGFWSAFTTLGANVGPGARTVLNVLAYFVAALLFVGFILPPLAVLLGMVS
ncbi:MAG: succinate dehydrogenase cytochrome b subunit [Propionibacteriaceae bacterium]|nr:succinate dehydrogenase cytochrome b subunit [Propionibacteriaceae bacterium]